MAKAIPRVSVQVEEDPRTHRAASNVIAVLPSSSSHGTFVAVASNGVAPVAGAFSVERPTTSGSSPIVSIAVYMMGTASPSMAEASSIVNMKSPDMMLLHTVSLCSDDLRRTPSPHAARTQMVNNSTRGPECMPRATSPPEPGTLTGAVWAGKNFFSPRVSETAPPTEPSPAEVEQMVWVGLEFLALKMWRGQLLLVRSGLTESVSPSGSDDDDNTQLDAFEELHGNHRDTSAVCTSFARVADFCSTTTSGGSANMEKGSSPMSLMIVAEQSHVTGVVCCNTAAMVSDRAQKAGSRHSRLTKQQPLLKKHTWNIGPFNHVAATPLANPKVCICGTSLSGSVEVYVWAVEGAGGEAVPLCVHQVLMGRGHFFYRIAVAVAAVSPNETANQAPRDISFWVVGSESAVIQNVQEECNCDAEAKTSTLPALRGLDGRVLEVNPKDSQVSRGHQSSNAPHVPAPVINAAPRTLNALWEAQSNRTPQTAGGVSKHAAVSSAADQTLLEDVYSLRVTEAPCFLLPQKDVLLKVDVDPTDTMPDCKLTHRYALLVHVSAKCVRGSEEDTLRPSNDSALESVAAEEKVACSSAILSLDNTDGASALGWLAAVSSEGGTSPLFSVSHDAPKDVSDEARQASIATVVSSMHYLTFSTPHRILQLCVSHRRDPADDSVKQLRFKVHGTFEISRPQRIVGIAPLVSPGATPQLLLLYGSASSAMGNNDHRSKDAQNVYGRSTRKSTWMVVENLHASILHKLTPWDPLVMAGTKSKGCSDEKKQLCEAELVEKIHAIVEAEGARIQGHLDSRMNRLEAMLERLLKTWQGQSAQS
ncbi:hypothetical protein JKF63_01900 [Porcisia hertigi]|uniref:Uncharacterized protein n=1 Tax=Porcisia hertigi TaxID=2761500 RepID=A0A836IBF1_9TRYP|nr:hypothetical protein JKF63_01900 [Porcisia hertigi]